MKPAWTSADIGNWMRRQQTLIAVLLTLVVLFDTASAFAVMTFNDSPNRLTSMTGNAHAMQSACSNDDPSHKQKPCCDEETSACMVHCASFLMLSSQPIPESQNRVNQKPYVLTDSIPLAHILPPLLRPPRI